MLKEIGAKLQKARKNAGYKQDEVARELGINRNKIINIERGESTVDIVLLSKLAHLYGYSLDYFIDDSSSGETDISFAYRASELGEEEKEILTWGKRVLCNLRDLHSICEEAGLIVH